jgi:predicted glycoside hydrolase/deacetylase ChbG (UPF0249 family)
MSAAQRQLILCADDFGQSEQISLGICTLIASGRLTATSVMSEGPYWPAGAKKLATLQHAADIGLHLNLTHAFNADNTQADNKQAFSIKHPLLYWLLFSQLRLLSRSRLTQIFCHQIDAFSKHLGRLPDFIDGHQHVHAFPVIRDALTDAIALRWSASDKKPWLRAPDQLIDGGNAPHKAKILQFLCRGFTAHATRHGLRVSHRFGGLYSLQPQADFPAQMQYWLRTAPHGALIMCHPGAPAVDLDDPINCVRNIEFDYLASSRFMQDCHEAGVQLTRFDRHS